MELQITGRQVETTQALTDFINKKFSKLHKFIPTNSTGHIIISLQNNQHICEANIPISGSKLFATEKAQNMYTAIDLIIDKLTHQAKKYKDKMKDHGYVIPKKQIELEDNLGDHTETTNQDSEIID